MTPSTSNASHSAGPTVERSFGGLVRLYALALNLYPRPFREAYAPAMCQTFRDALRDRSLSLQKLVPLVFRDLLISLAKEHFSMLHDSFTRPALVFNALVLAGISTVLALALYAIPQQVLRAGLNDPQIQLASDLTTRLEQGATPSEAIPAASIDMARSLAPFVIAYDDQGHPLASQAQLNGATPAPPSGVFEFVRQHGEERLSWQPIRGSENGVRIAAVVQRVNGAHPGFVLAGRNMREVETRIDKVQSMAGLTWLAMLGMILVGAVAVGWSIQPRSA
jgi:hypothetical protein